MRFHSERDRLLQSDYRCKIIGYLLVAGFIHC